MLSVIGLGFWVIGAGLLAVGIVVLRRGGRTKSEVGTWVPASGTVVRIVREDQRAQGGDATIAMRYPVVRFVDGRGREQEGTARTAASWQRHQEGERVGLRYDPQDPRRIVLDGAPAGTGPIGFVTGCLFTAFGAFWILIGILTLVISLKG